MSGVGQLGLIDRALISVIKSGSGSTSRLMRELGISRREADGVMDELERRRVVSAANAAGARTVLSS